MKRRTSLLERSTMAVTAVSCLELAELKTWSKPNIETALSITELTNWEPLSESTSVGVPYRPTKSIKWCAV